LRVPYTEAAWAGIVFEELAPDWSRQREFRVDVENPDRAQLHLVIGIHDDRYNQTADDRYTGHFEVAPRTRRIITVPLREIEAAPRSRSMNLRAIRRLAIGQERARHLPEFLIHRIWLE
jgi:hypothetical protein